MRTLMALQFGGLAFAQQVRLSPFAAGYEYPAPFLIAPGQLITLLDRKSVV